MPAGKFDDAFSPGDVMRRLRGLERRVDLELSGRRLESASIGRGGLRVRGGQILIQDAAGDTMMTLATEGLTLEGFIRILGGAGLTVEDGGTIVAEYPSGNRGILFGTVFSQSTGDISGHGLLIRDDVPPMSGALNVFRALRRPDGSSQVLVGNPPDEAVDIFSVVSGVAQIWTTTDPILLLPDTQVLGVSVSNTTGTANMIIDPDFGPGVGSQIRRVTSSAAFKVDIEDLDVDTGAVMKLRPRTWRDRGEVEEDPDTDRWQVGLVAEEVDEAGLREFVDYDADGAPVAVAYDRLSIALLEVVRQLSARVDALDGGPLPGKVARAARRKPRRLARRGRGLTPRIVDPS